MATSSCSYTDLSCAAHICTYSLSFNPTFTNIGVTCQSGCQYQTYFYIELWPETCVTTTKSREHALDYHRHCRRLLHDVPCQDHNFFYGNHWISCNFKSIYLFAASLFRAFGVVYFVINFWFELSGSMSFRVCFLGTEFMRMYITSPFSSNSIDIPSLVVSIHG